MQTIIRPMSALYGCIYHKHVIIYGNTDILTRVGLQKHNVGTKLTNTQEQL